MEERDEGELAIAVSGGWVRLIEGPQGVAFAPIQIQIDYNLQIGHEVIEGIVFRQADNGDVSQRQEHIKLTSRPLTCISRRLAMIRLDFGPHASIP